MKEKLFHHVSINFFEKDSIEDTLKLLDTLLPFSALKFLEEGKTIYERDKENTIKRVLAKEQADLTIQESKGFETPINVVTLFFKKIAHTNEIFMKLKELLSEDDWNYLKDERELHVDDYGFFYLRLDLDELRKGNYVLTTSGNCLHYKFSLAAYPKKHDTILAILEKLMA